MSKTANPLRWIYRYWWNNRRKMIWKTIGIFNTKIKVETKQGRFLLPTDPTDNISSSLYLRKGYTVEKTDAFMDLANELRPLPQGQRTVLDIGANNGVIAISHIVRGKAERAVCIEPERSNFRRLNDNIELNHLKDRVQTFQYAITDSEKLVDFEISKFDKGDHRVKMDSLTDKEYWSESSRKAVAVQGISLDSLVRKNNINLNEISVIWMDTQGHEGHIFKGGNSTFSLGIPVVCELSPYLILRSGMSLNEYIKEATRHFNYVWELDDIRPQKHSIEHLPKLIDQYGTEGKFDDVLFI